MLQAIRCAAITGSTISAAISRIPTILIEIATVRAASTATVMFISQTRTPTTRLPSASRTDPTRPRYEDRDRRQTRGPEDEHNPEIAPGHGEDRSEEELEQVHIEPTCTRDEHDPERDAGVEDQCERLIAAAATAPAQPLDRERADERKHERAEDRRDAEEVSSRDAGEREVPEPVADERCLALDEEEADRGREEPDDSADRKGDLHELEPQHQWV